MRSLILLAIVFALVACGSPKTAETPDVEPDTTRDVEVDQMADIGLTPVTFEEWQRELASMEGEIVVVDLWATWCAPCIERFPKMVEMSDRYADRGVRFVSLSLDDRDDDSTVSQVRQFLRESDVSHMANYLMDEIIPDAFEKLDLLGIPAVFVYDGDGNLRYRLTGDDPRNQFTEEDVKDAVEELLRERDGPGENQGRE